MYDFCFSPIYSVFLAVAGLYAFISQGSKASLYGGVGSAVVLGALSYASLQHYIKTKAVCKPTVGLSLVVAAGLTYMMFRRYEKTHALAPAVIASVRLPQVPPIYCQDEDNRVVGAEPRDVTVRNRLLGRGAYVLVSNREGELLVSKRSSSKDVYPGHWDVVIAGVVRAGEEYEDTAARELAEEIGVSEDEARRGLRRLFVFPYQDRYCHVWGCAFEFTHSGGELRLQEDEVDWAGFKSMEQVARMLAEEQFTPVGRHILDLRRRMDQS
ncbi:hypothetical protein GPECTOR_17g850 [Gonium pectorale]|uniref:Nudix hydrolase domain-containing protein n=1 Tax=Gonium pectorale TaxID=33097 RepID=A0A150GK52_GONPE|nr:hypothetical protein GPECTOR_17g850 [Gonium pectorale]|eukprot:KXZ50213.1 hypothetical protein GPECTOR_17g850 [Gonium pectorale]